MEHRLEAEAALEVGGAVGLVAVDERHDET